MRNFKPVNPIARDPNGRMGIDIASISDIANSVKFSSLEQPEGQPEITRTIIGKVTSITGGKTFNFNPISIDHSNVVYAQSQVQEGVALNALPEVDDYVQLTLYRTTANSFKWLYIQSDITYLEEKLTECCGCLFDATIVGATKGSTYNKLEDFTYPLVNQAQWNILRNSQMALLNNTGAPQSEPIGGLGRYGYVYDTIQDFDTTTVDITVYSNDYLKFTFDTSTIDPAATILSAVLITTTDIIETGVDGDIYAEKFTFGLYDDTDTVIRSGMESDTPDYAVSGATGKWKITLPIGLINTTGDTELYWRFESEFDTNPAAWELIIGDDTKYWQGWRHAPISQLYVLTDIPCSGT